MVVPLGNDELHGLAGFLQPFGEFPTLALEFRRLERSVNHGDRRGKAIEVPHGAQLLQRALVELHVRAARGKRYRQEVVHAADQHIALHDIGRQADLLPVRGGEHARLVRPRRMAGHVDASGVAAEARGVARYPDERAADLLGDRQEACARVLHPGEVRYDVVGARVDEHLGRERVVLRHAGAPGAAVDEHMDRRVGALGAIEVELLDRLRAVGDAPRRAEARSRELAVRRIAAQELLQIWRVLRLVVRRIERGLVVVAEHLRSFGEHRCRGERAGRAGKKIPAVHSPSSNMRSWPR